MAFVLLARSHNETDSSFDSCSGGADANGRWTGTLTVSTSDGGENPGPAHLVLKQEGAKLTGTAGSTASDPHAIQNGKAESGNLAFEVSTGGAIMKFALKHEGDEIKGDVARERGGRTQTAKLAVKRDQSNEPLRGIR